MIARAAFLPLAFLLLLLIGCSSTPPAHNGERIGERAAQLASSMQGKPYRYGGHTPAGFDCSGLVHYSYSKAGAHVPRSTEGLWRASRSIASRQLRPGDLLFFTQEGKRSSHVGLYLGNDRFVHAPSSGKNVSIARLSERYWQRHFEGGRRPRIE